MHMSISQESANIMAREAGHRGDLNESKTTWKKRGELVVLKDGRTGHIVGYDPDGYVVQIAGPSSQRPVAHIKQATTQETQNARLYSEVRDALDRLLVPGGVALSFGWNSAGFGRRRGYDIAEIMLVAHGGAHNDTICVAEVKRVGLARPAHPWDQR